MLPALLRFYRVQLGRRLRQHHVLPRDWRKRLSASNLWHVGTRRLYGAFCLLVDDEPTLEGRVLQDALLSVDTNRRGYLGWDVDHAGWVVTLHHPEEQTFDGRVLEEALAWCLVVVHGAGERDRALPGLRVRRSLAAPVPAVPLL